MNEKQQKLINLLKEMFQLNQNDLDFGIYRIMNIKADEISQFLEKDLINSIKNAFSSSSNTAIENELKEAIKQANALEIDPDTLPKVQQLKEKLTDSNDSASLENEIYSHLTTFFSRYYKDGDFVSLRRYKKDTYAIPYEGEEVKLHWANADQYYIKTSEYLRDYTFKIKDKTIHFKLNDADTEKNNNKAADDKERRFVLLESDKKPFMEEINGELYIYFQYIPKGKSIKQKDLNTKASKTIVESDEAFLEWVSLLTSPDLKFTGKGTRNILEKHITSYTARNSFDYFIHKDLKGFLSRELDFYIKNEILFIDDIEDSTTQQLEESLNKVEPEQSI